jgi:hypothetical protein
VCARRSYLPGWVARHNKTILGLLYLAGNRWSFGGAINLANVNVDITDIEDGEGNPEFTARVNMDVNDVSVFVRVRF